MASITYRYIIFLESKYLVFLSPVNDEAPIVTSRLTLWSFLFKLYLTLFIPYLTSYSSFLLR